MSELTEVAGRHSMPSTKDPSNARSIAHADGGGKLFHRNVGHNQEFARSSRILVSSLPGLDPVDRRKTRENCEGDRPA
jgi:hypothetical protein